MSTSTNVVRLRQPDEIDDPLTEVLRAGARRLLAQAVELEAEGLFRAEQNQATRRRKFRPLRRPWVDALARRKLREEKPLRSLWLSQNQPLRPLIRGGRVA